MRRREMLRLLAIFGTAAAAAPAARAWARKTSPRAARQGAYGRWIVRDGVPAFAYDADHESLAGAEWDPLLAPRDAPALGHGRQPGDSPAGGERRHGGGVRRASRAALAHRARSGRHGRLARRATAASHGERTTRSAAAHGRRCAPSGRPGSRCATRAPGSSLDAHHPLPRGRGAVGARARAPGARRRAPAARTVQHVERWALRPRFLNLLESADQRRARAEAGGVLRRHRVARRPGRGRALRAATGRPRRS